MKLTWMPFFQNFQSLNIKKLDLQVKMCFAERTLFQGRTDFTAVNF